MTSRAIAAPADITSDIHPWDILINGQRWAGKVRLVGFVDSFYLICYSGQSRFEHGIVVYSQFVSDTEL
jgi:hypothetical protein